MNMGIVKNITDNDFDAEVGANKGITLVDFWAPWCGPCKMMAPVYEKAAEKFTKIKFCKINTDENLVKPREADITGIPCIVVYRDGKEAGRIIGYRDQKNFESELAKFD
jgi:thioredoxin 1